MKIRILGNTHCKFTGLKAAEKYIRKGVAQWVHHGASIRMVTGNHRIASAATNRHNAEIESMAGYDASASTRLLPRSGAKHVPILGDFTKLLMLKTKRSATA